jgi:hypothetical protein
VPGRPDGTIAAPLSRVAILAAIAARAALLPDGGREKFTEEHGLRIGPRDINRALAHRRRPAGSEAPADPDQREWLWDSFEVDTAKLGLDLVLAWIPRPTGPGRRKDQGRLLGALRSTPGVISILDCFDDTILVQALAVDPPGKRRLQTRLEELVPEVIWSEVRQVDRDQAARGWLDVARTVAGVEARLDPARDLA